TSIPTADVLLLESTYGDRLHEPDDNGARLAEIIKSTYERGGKLIIPSFAIGRVEEVLYWLRHLEDAARIPSLPVYVDSPMAVAALQFYSARLDELDPGLGDGVRAGVRDGVRAGVRHGVRDVAGFATSRFTTISSPQQHADLVASRK